jgi:hypothetical protein
MWADIFNVIDPQSKDGAAPIATLNTVGESGAGGADDLFKWINRGVDVYTKVTAAPLKSPNQPAQTVTSNPTEVGPGKPAFNQNWILGGLGALLVGFLLFKR